MASPKKRKSSDIYYFRRRVPSDLVAVFGREVIFSLKTKDNATAKRLFVEESVRFDDKMEQARLLQSRPYDTLTVYRAEALAGAWFQDVLDADNAHRMETDGEDLIDPQANVTAHQVTLEEILRIKELPTRRRRAALFAFVNSDVEEISKLYDLNLEPEGVSHLRLAEAVFSAMERAELVREARMQKDMHRANELQGVFVVGFPTLPPRVDAPSNKSQLNSTGVEGPLLSEVVAAYLKEKNLPKGTQLETDKSIRRFIEAHGDVAASAVSKAMVREWKALLEQLPKRQTAVRKKMKLRELVADCANLLPEQRIEFTSVNKDVGTLCTVLNFASTRWDFSDFWKNPAEGMKTERPRDLRRKDRASFSDEDLQNIFSMPIFTKGVRPKSGAGEAAKWLPLLAMYTGARLEELGQLQVNDVVSVSGVWCIDINENDGKGVKTKNSIRKVPLHRDLVERLGFLEYVTARRKVGDRVRLFHELKRDVKGTWTGSWGKFFGRILRESVEKGGCGIDDRSKVFHSFRHTFKTKARAAGVPEYIHDAMTGHHREGVGATYGEREPIIVQSEWLEKITFLAVSRALIRSEKCE